MRTVAILDSYPGNGHCYSFSAIINGLSVDNLEICPFSGIRKYITNYSTPHHKLSKEFTVNSVWMKDINESKRVSAFAGVPHIGSTFMESATRCDVIIITNDEPDDRNEMLLNLLPLGKPIFVDKLLARNLSELRKIQDSIQYTGQIYSGSSLPVAPDFEHLELNRADVANTVIQVPKSWKLYGIHAVALFLQKIGYRTEGLVVKSSCDFSGGGRIIEFESATNEISTVKLVATGLDNSKFLVLQTLSNLQTVTFELLDPFSSFCNLLLDFYNSVVEPSSQTEYWCNQMKLIEVLNAR